MPFSPEKGNGAINYMPEKTENRRISGMVRADNYCSRRARMKERGANRRSSRL